MLSRTRFSPHCSHRNPDPGGDALHDLSPLLRLHEGASQAGIQAVFYLHGWSHPDEDLWSHPDEDLRHEYEKLQNRIPGGIRRIEIDDPDKDWAIPSKAKSVEDMPGEILERALRPSGEATAAD